ncbi:MAG: amino acid ABC transporter permease [Alphaproteobacteria bacterium]|nr:amino acid ABC transporter permease [Alphaproteobacteria bacterium]
MANTSKAYVATGLSKALPPPLNTTGVIGWIRQNLFRTWFDGALTLFALYLIVVILMPSIDWIVVTASFEGMSRAECRAVGKGACWAFIGERLDQFVYGFYPLEERWRVNLAGLLLLITLVPLVFDKVPGRMYLFGYGLLYPAIAYFLLTGGFVLPEVDTQLFGGIMLTILVGITGITFSLPLGILLALARRSDMIFISVMAVAFIEFIRGVPLITLLFVASSMLNYFFPPGTSFDLLVRVLIMVTLFSAGYIAETVRGGLQAIPNGQQEAADALGLGYWQSVSLIILPQALKIAIPGIVNIFIGLFKDTTLVSIIGLLDPIGIGRAALSDIKWAGLSTEVYLFVALFFFVCCFAMSRYSMYLERKLHTGYKR